MKKGLVKFLKVTTILLLIFLTSCSKNEDVNSTASDIDAATATGATSANVASIDLAIALVNCY